MVSFKFTLIISALGSTSLLCTTRQFLLAAPIFFLALRSLAFPQHHCQWHWTIWTCNLLFIWEKSNGNFFFWVPRFWARKIPPSQLLNVLNWGDQALWSWLPSPAWSTPSPAVSHLAFYEVSLFPHCQVSGAGWRNGKSKE